MGLTVTGLDETIAAFAAYARVLEEEAHRALDESGRVIRDAARRHAQAQGLDGTGKYSRSRDPHPGALIEKISYRVFSDWVRVSETSRTTHHSPRYVRYAYPRRYEYGDRARPFMVPALRESREQVKRFARDALARTRDRVGLHE